MLWLGTRIKQNAGAFRTLGAVLAGSVSFFLGSNFAVWAGWEDVSTDLRRADDVL